MTPWHGCLHLEDNSALLILLDDLQVTNYKLRITKTSSYAELSRISCETYNSSPPPLPPFPLSSPFPLPAMRIIRWHTPSPPITTLHPLTSPCACHISIYVRSLQISSHLDQDELPAAAQQYSAIQYKTIRYDAVQYNIMQYDTMRCSTIQCNTIRYDAIQYNTIQFNTIQYSTIQ